jgi:hypothetical protein
MYQLGKPNLYAIAKSIKEIQKEFSHVISGFKKIHTDIYTAEDRDKEAADDAAYIENMKDENNKNSEPKNPPDGFQPPVILTLSGVGSKQTLVGGMRWTSHFG